MLNKDQIKRMIHKKRLIQGYIDLDKQLTPNGIDLTISSLSKFSQAGSLDFSNKERKLPQGEELLPQKESKESQYGWWSLASGAYKVKTNETVNLPNNLMALAFSRTSLLRMGCFTSHGVWDAGFSGRGEFILSVQNPEGVKIKENARLVQLVFMEIEETQGYEGIYKNLS